MGTLTMEHLEQLQVPLENLTLQGRESYSSASASYSGMSESYSSNNSFEKHEVRSGYLNDYSDFEASLCRHRRYSMAETVDTSVSFVEDYSFLEKYPKLVDLESLPWVEQEVLNVLREGRTKRFSGHITVEMMQHLAYILQRPLVRIAKEAQRLSATFHNCTKHEVHTAIKLVLSQSLAESCSQACLKAVALYSMGTDSLKQSKSSRCGLHFSIGRFHRWMTDAQIGVRVQEYAAVYLAACMENLLEEIVLHALGKEQLGGSVLTLESLQHGISTNAELWGLLQPYQHLVTGRNASGLLSLPNSFNLYERQADRRSPDNSLVKTVEQSLLATCVGTISELGDLVSQAMHHWYNRPQSQGSHSPTSQRFHPLSWSSDALHTLYYYMRCTQVEHADDPNVASPSVHLHSDRPYAVVPPLMEWIRVAVVHTEHRGSWVLDANDIQQAARLLLPGVDCPPRIFGPDETLSMSRHMDAQKCVVKFHQDLAFRMLASGRSDLIPEALRLLGQGKVNTVNEQGLTPLMYACIRGDEAMVHMLLDAGAKINISVPSDHQKYPCVHPETKHWTALTFAAAQGHLAIVQLLLERGASTEGSYQPGEENVTETPLQMAASAGHYEMVSCLLSKEADPFLNTIPKNGASFAYGRGGYNAIVLASAHGHRNVVRKLLTNPVSRSTEVLSLEEILAEGTSDTLKNRYNKQESQCRVTVQVQVHQTSIPDPDSHDNTYMSIEEVAHDNRPLSNRGNQNSSGKAPLTKSQFRSMQEALYHSAENGHLEIALELRKLEVPWSMHTWSRCLDVAFHRGKKSLVQSLLSDFVGNKCADDLSLNFIYDSLPLLFDILKANKNEVTSQQVADILTSLYGQEAIQPIQQPGNLPPARIDPRYVNNPELSDIQFVIEGKLFYAHKIILVNASNRFRAMLSNKFCEGSQPRIEISDVRYKMFEYLMQYLYHGGAHFMHIESKDILELLAAANFYLLDGLQRHCEGLCAKKLNFDNSVPIYKHAKLYHSLELMSYCEGFFLQNLPSLLSNSESFRKLLYKSKMQTYDLANGLLATLTQRLEDRLLQKGRQPQMSPLSHVVHSRSQTPQSVKTTL